MAPGEGKGTADGYDGLEYKYNRQGGLIELKDQTETVHQYSYDKLGRDEFRGHNTDIGILGKIRN